jgi:tetratricopeptide (TPR) repeat protein
LIERQVAHAYELLPDIDRALDWYDYCLRRDPDDQVAHGATVTIRLRYLPAWRKMQAGDYEGAIEAIDEFLSTDPNDTIGLHVKAHIYEQAGDLESAFDAWMLAARVSTMDTRAAVKAQELATRIGRELPPELLTAQGKLQEHQGGLNVPDAALGGRRPAGP